MKDIFEEKIKEAVEREVCWMTYSQINQPEGWGFSRNLEIEYSVFGDVTGQTKIGDFSC